MKELLLFFGEMITAVALSGFLYAVVPEGNIKKYIRFLLSVCVLASIAMPLVKTVTNLPKTFFDTEIHTDGESETAPPYWEESMAEESKIQIENAVSGLLHQKYGGEFTVDAELDTSDMQNIRIVCIKVYGENLTSDEKVKIRAYLQDLFMGETAIEVYKGETA